MEPARCEKTALKTAIRKTSNLCKARRSTSKTKSWKGAIPGALHRGKMRYVQMFGPEILGIRLARNITRQSKTKIFFIVLAPMPGMPFH
jgi:hypothetical protein